MTLTQVLDNQPFGLMDLPEDRKRALSCVKELTQTQTTRVREFANQDLPENGSWFQTLVGSIREIQRSAIA
jgi:hypothetical protein